MKRGLLGEERRLDDLPDLDALLPVDPGDDVDQQQFGMSGRLVHEALPAAVHVLRGPGDGRVARLRARADHGEADQRLARRKADSRRELTAHNELADVENAARVVRGEPVKVAHRAQLAVEALGLPRAHHHRAHVGRAADEARGLKLLHRRPHREAVW